MIGYFFVFEDFSFFGGLGGSWVTKLMANETRPFNCSSLQASSSKDNLYASINDVFHKLERQLNKHQHKSESRRVSNGEKAKQMEINKPISKERI